MTRPSPTTTCIALCLGIILSTAIPISAAEVPDQKLILDFETSGEVQNIIAHSENTEFDVVQDYCVTRHKNCLRIVGMMEQPYCSMVVTDTALLAGAENYDYVAMDAFNNSENTIKLTLELWDADSVDYFSRSTMDSEPVEERNVSVRPGMNRLYWPISKARRNGKEGMEWKILKPENIIDRSKLTKLKFFFKPLQAGGDTKMWIDNVRYVKAHMVGGMTEAPELPKSAIAYKFGNAFYCPKGWESIAIQKALPGRPQRAKGVMGTGVAEAGGQWPDTITGNGLVCPQGNFTFTADVPDGEYWVWVNAGKVLNKQTTGIPFQLKIGDTVLVDEEHSQKTFYSDKGIFRYINTQYSQRKNALWLDYALPEAESYTVKARATGGRLRVRISNLLLSSMVLVPVKHEREFKQWTEAMRQARIDFFYQKTWVNVPDSPVAPKSSGDYTLWTPDVHAHIRPWSAPTEAQNKQSFQWSGARGQHLSQRVCVTPWKDLGSGDITISDFKGPSVIPASSIRTYYMNYRFMTGNGSVSEMALLPRTNIRFEPGLTWSYWMWMEVPTNAAPGTYTAELTFTPDQGKSTMVPITLSVYPFTLNDPLPVSYGMYYEGWGFRPRKEDLPTKYSSVDQFVMDLTKKQFKFMRDIGFTGTRLPAPFVHEYHFRSDGKRPYWDAAREAGLGQIPEQKMMASSLHLGRRVGRDLFYEAGPKRYGMDWLDRNPGDEFSMPQFRGKLMPVFKQYKKWIDSTGLPVCLEVVDEPREVANPWNRRRDETIRYAEMLKNAGFEDIFVSFMGDKNTGLDYTPIVDYIDTVAVHATADSKGLIARTRETKKTLWLYNVGMDRFSWGFYNWAMESAGRWEWHFCFPTAGGVKGFRNTDQWYNPFTSLDGYAMHAPYFDYPGGMTFKTVFFTVQEGITDYAYIYKLERTIAAAVAADVKADTVKEAREFLAAVKKEIPEFPHIKNMVGEGSGALVGSGIDIPVAQMTNLWRKHIAELIVKLEAE